jgi:hypothetical protein
MTTVSQVLIPQNALAFQYRMGTGFPGTITRSQASSVEPGLIYATNPPTFFGQAVVEDASGQGLRPPVAGDGFIAGVTVRAFPTQGNFPATPQVDPLGTANVPLTGEVDVLRRGYIAVTLSGASLTPIRYSPVYAWLGATAGTHIKGGFETAPTYTYTTAAKTGGNTGNGTFTVAPTAGTVPLTGVYTLTMLTATTFSLIDPNGVSMPNGATGTPYADAKINFTLSAGGTAFVAGDGFTITNTASTLLLPNSYFMGPPDSSGVTELAFNI